MQTGDLQCHYSVMTTHKCKRNYNLSHPFATIRLVDSAKILRLFPFITELLTSLLFLTYPGSIPGLRRSPGEREWQPTPVFLPGEFHGQRSLVGSMGSQRVGHNWAVLLIKLTVLLIKKNLNAFYWPFSLFYLTSDSSLCYLFT